MNHKAFLALAASVAFLTSVFAGCEQAESVSSSASSSTGTQQDPVAKPTGWLSWRGPNQNGTSLEKGLPSKVEIGGEKSWSFQLSGRATPVIANGRVYAMGYEGTETELEELIVCLDENTGKKIWEHRFTDFLSDIIYYRFAISSPTVDPETGNVTCMSTSGLLVCFTADGKLVWERSMMSEYGRLTFPNGRTGAPIILGDQCIMHTPTSGWGPQGPARSRFFAFDKKTGTPLWTSTPGGPPKDASFSFPVVGMENGKRVLYAGLAGGYLVCINALNGDPIWRFRLAIGGLSSSVVKYKDTIITINGKENIDNSKIGRMVSVRCGSQPEGKGQIDVTKTNEVWRNDLMAFTSSPVLVGNRLYQTVHHGELHCIDADSGKSLWHAKLAPDQIHASPAYGDGKLYVPMNNGTFFIIEPSDKEGKILQKLQLEGNCLGAPAIANGRIYVHTTEKLYSFAGGTGEIAGTPDAIGEMPAKGPAVRLQVIPADIALKTGDSIQFRVRSLDANGQVVDENVKKVTWKNVPGDGVAMDESGKMVIASSAASTAGVMTVEANGMKGSARLRIVPGGNFTENFEDVVLKPHPKDGHAFSFPRAHWPGAKPKWEILELDGEKVVAKALLNPLFQRTITNIGHPDASNYTMQMDVRSDGNRRTMSSAGMVNQRYQIALSGNYQELEVSSNMELYRKAVPYKWKRNTWYTIKSRVDVNKDGSGFIRAKVWLRGEKEPEAWTIEAPHSHIHKKGAPGIYGFALQNRFRVYIDNISVKSNND